MDNIQDFNVSAKPNYLADEYVNDIYSQYYNDIENTDEKSYVVNFIKELLAYHTRLYAMHWSAKNNSMHQRVDEFNKILEDYIDAISEVMQGVFGESFKDDDFNDLQTDFIKSSALETLDKIKENVIKFMLFLKDKDYDYEGARNATSGFLENVMKYMYLFRLCND